LRGLIDSAIESLFGFGRTLREQVRNRLKTEQQSVKTLQQSVVQFPRDARALREPFFKPGIQLTGQREHPEPSVVLT
jgi:hypothetical protein